jgi:hypothetical protein
VFERLRWACRGVRGGVATDPIGGSRGAEPPARGFKGNAPEIFFFGPTYFRRFRADIFSPGRHISGTTYFRDHMILGGFSAHGFFRWFSISG